MSKREGQNQEDAIKAGKPGESSLTGLLHDFHNSEKKAGQIWLNWRLAPVFIASLCLSVVLIVGIYRIGVQGFKLREKVEELAQENTQLEEMLKSVEEGVLYAKQEPESGQSIPAKSVSEKPRPEGKRASEKPSKIAKIMYRVKEGDSLSQIGERFGVSVEQLRSWNGIEQTEFLQAEQVLIINRVMTTRDLPDVVRDGGRRKVAEIDARAESGYTSKAKALAQIAAVRAETEAANKAIAQLEGKLDSEVQKNAQTIAMLQEEVQRRKTLEEKLIAEYISKQTALEQINEAAGKAETANKAIAQLEEKLQSERKIRNLTIAMLQEEVQKREALEGKLAAEYISKQTALEQINEAAGKADAANEAIAQVQAKLDSEREEHGERVAGLEAEAEAEAEGQKALEKESTTAYIPKEEAIEQLKEAAAKAEAASRAVSELQTKLDSEIKKSEQTIAILQQEIEKRKALEEKLATDSIPKRAALEQISEAVSKAEAASTAVAQLRGRVDSERREYEQTVAGLQAEVEKRRSLEQELATDYIPKEKALERITEARAEVEAANRAVSELGTRLDSERKEYEQTMQRLEEDLAIVWSSSLSREEDIEQIAALRAEAEAANKAIAQLQAKLNSEVKKGEQRTAILQEEVQKRKALEKKLATDYISKQVALQEIGKAEAKAETASRALSELHTKLDSERKGYEQTTVKRLEEEAGKARDFEEEPVTERTHASQSAATGRAVGRQATSDERTDEYRATGGQETSTGKPTRETVHVIREGENLYRIGIKYGVSWKTLVKFNNLVDANAIYVGQKIRIPKLEKADARSTSLDEM